MHAGVSPGQLLGTLMKGFSCPISSPTKNAPATARAHHHAHTKCPLPGPLPWKDRPLLTGEFTTDAALPATSDQTRGADRGRETVERTAGPPRRLRGRCRRALEGSECHAGRPRPGRRLCGGAAGESPVPVEWWRDLLGESVPTK